jgi:hypothetical protein
VTDPYERILGFLNRTRFQAHYFSENVAPGIEPGPLYVKPRTLTTRPQSLSLNVREVILQSHKTSDTIIFLYIQEIRLRCVDWILLALDKDKLWVLPNMKINFRIS